MKERRASKFWKIDNSINHFFNKDLGNSQKDLILSFLRELVEDPDLIGVRIWRKIENERERQTLEKYEKKNDL